MIKTQRRLKYIISRLCIFLVFFLGCNSLFSEELQYLDNTKPKSVCIKEEDVYGSGLYPYNFRLIDNCLAAGGSLFNPVSKTNSDEKVCEYISFLKKLGINSLMLLHVPLKTDSLTARLENCCKKEGIELIKMRMNAEQLPTDEQTESLMQAIASGSYVHCMWGCDIT